RFSSARATRDRSTRCPPGSGARPARAASTSPARAAWTDSSMRCWNVRCSAIVLAAALASGCASDAAAPRAQIVAARIEAGPAPVLVADIKLAFSSEMLEALDRGIVLKLELELSAPTRASVQRSLTLRYLPLAQRYQLRDDA